MTQPCEHYRHFPLTDLETESQRKQASFPGSPALLVRVQAALCEPLHTVCAETTAVNVLSSHVAGLLTN